MTIANYVDLVAALKSWGNRGDMAVGDRAPDFIRLGEARIWRTVRSMWGVSAPTVLTVPAGSNYVALPTDWLGFDSLYTVAEPNLDYMDYAGLSRMGAPGRPDRYSIRGPNFFFGQTVAVNLPVTCTYFQHPGYLNATTTASTWLLARAPDLYLYAALIELAIFVKKTDKAGEFGQLFEAAHKLYMSAEKGDLIRGQRLRMRRHG